MSDVCEIYTLSDPATGEVRYVGRSKDARRRFDVHLQDATRSGRTDPRVCWIKSLLARGLRPAQDVIERCPLDQWAARERYWIEWLKWHGARLTNTNDGGYGPWQQTEETRRKRSAATTARNRQRKGIPASASARASWSAAQKRRLAGMSAEARRARVDPMLRQRKPGWNRGHHLTAETKARIGAANRLTPKRRGHHLSEDTKAKISASKRATAAEKKRCQTTE